MSDIVLPAGVTPSQNDKDKNLRNHALTLALGSSDRGITTDNAIKRADAFMSYIDGKDE